MAKAARVMTADERACFDQMLDWHHRIDQLMGMYDPQSRSPQMPRARWEEARALYTAIKNGLRDEYKRLSNSRNKPTAAESRWLQRPIHHAYVALSAPTNHPPAKWFSCLFDARGDLSHMLYEMRDYFGLTDVEI